jgi:hypothetical protein
MPIEAAGTRFTSLPAHGQAGATLRLKPKFPATVGIAARAKMPPNIPPRRRPPNVGAPLRRAENR